MKYTVMQSIHNKPAMSIHERFNQVLLLTAPTEKRNKWLEDQTGIPASKWMQLLLGRQKCTPEMLEAFCQRWPEYAEWLMTGDVLVKQESPAVASTEELLDSAMQKVKAASSKEEFEQASQGLAKAVAFAAVFKKSGSVDDGNHER
ncbi:MAG: hypothetical protein ACK4S6_17355 [Roseateles asaccharophilus]